MNKIWDRKSFEVGGHWQLWRGWKNNFKYIHTHVFYWKQKEPLIISDHTNRPHLYLSSYLLICTHQWDYQTDDRLWVGPRWEPGCSRDICVVFPPTLWYSPYNTDVHIELVGLSSYYTYILNTVGSRSVLTTEIRPQLMKWKTVKNNDIFMICF